ncbi:MAG: HAMP domain-containing histidine kinase [Defluviitaleaceae bacterium]|nr:HAMP domain-containing histidine kinase [Defluviitaleaceae bacterium]
MMESLVIILALLCLGQFIYIYRMKKQIKNWLDVLRDVRHGRREKIFAKNKGLMTDVSYELNMVMEDNQIALLKKSDEANKQILTSLSHDVRTPLASLLGYLEALDKGLPNANNEKEYISIAYRKANDLKAFVDMLFEWFKLNSNEQQYHFESVDINEATREILIEWLHVFKQSQIVLQATIDDDDLVVDIDNTAYKRILNNLIQNAMTHGECTKIKISIKSDLDSVVVNVANNGHSIPKQHLSHIFERMYKCETSRADKGNGLGLAITKELVTVLNGDISVSSIQGEDTIFTILFPIAK